ncbi:MAG: hypothetical protein ACI8XO_000264 [Verrucomicrobiales bacterium]|jgi:hypothetical protein
MHPLKRLLTYSSLLATATCANATVVSVGVDTAADANWRTAAQYEADQEYGSAGYVIYGLNEADAVYTPGFDLSEANPANAHALPGGITISTIDTAIAMWSGNGNFGTMQDPGNANSITSAPVLANSTGTKQFTITRATSVPFRITILMASGDDQGTEYTVAVDDGSGPSSSSYDHVANGLAYHVFDVSSASTDIVINLTSTAENRSLSGIAFDSLAGDLSDPTDFDENGIGDIWEEFYFGDTGIVDPAVDEEPDGLTNLEEWQNLTNPKGSDSDADGLQDGEEVNTYSTDPTETDTDSDGFQDKYEVDNIASGFDPLVDDSTEDPDNDDLDNAGELANGTDPIDPDSDDDNVDDGDEVSGAVNPYSGGVAGAVPGDPTDPNNPDSDGDTIEDFVETDSTNGSVTDPNRADTDGDGYSDLDEINLHSTDPTDAGSAPTPPAGLISVDIQGDPTDAAFTTVPILMSGYDFAYGIPTGAWNAFNIVGHPNTEIDPSMPLVDATGQPTSVTFTIFGTLSAWSYANRTEEGTSAITDDYLFIDAGNSDASATWELSGLTAGSVYAIYAYGSYGRTIDFIIDSDGDSDLSDETATTVGVNGLEFTATVGTDGKIIGALDSGGVEANLGGFHLVPMTIAADSDGDGLSDELEDDFGTDPNNPDSDGDGQTDGQEANVTGTDPTNPKSVFKVASIRRTGGDSIELTWTSIPGKSYAVEVDTDLGSWVQISSGIDAAASPAAVTTQVVEAPAAGETRQQYRVRVE